MEMLFPYSSEALPLLEPILLRLPSPNKVEMEFECSFPRLKLNALTCWDGCRQPAQGTAGLD